MSSYKLNKLMLSPDLGESWLQEVWRAYKGDKLIYDKSKTLSNCLLNYEMAQEESEGNLRIITINKQNPHSIPELSDIDSYANNESSMIRVHQPTKGKIFQQLNDYYRTHPVTQFNSLFGTMWVSAGDIKLPDWKIIIDTSSPYGAASMWGFKGTNVETVHFHFINGTLRSLDGLFQDCHHFKKMVITYEDPSKNALNSNVGLQPVSVSRLFRSNSVTSENFIRDINYANCREFFSFCNNAYNLKVLPPVNGCDPFSEDYGNVLVPNSGPWNQDHADVPHWYSQKSFHVDIANYGSAHEMFGWCPELVEIGTPIDCKYLKNPWGIGDMFHCPKLERVRIKNLSNIDWNFGPNGSHLPGLDEGSVRYLVDNIVDLAGKYKDGEWNSTFILVPESTLTVPEEWLKFIGEEDMKKLKRMGWTLKTESKQLN